MPKIFFILFLLINCACFASTPAALNKHTAKSIPAILKADSSSIKMRHLDTAALNQYNQLPEFKYDKITEDSLWTRFWRWFWQWLENLFSGKQSGHSHTSTFVKYLLLALAVGFLVYIIVKATGVTNIFGKKAMEITVPYTELLENIDNIKFDKEIEKAVSLGNYRLAVRLLYLSCLKQLNDKQLIKWQLEKTNSTYINELNDGGQRRLFGSLTRQFEFVWYGNFALDKETYQTINSLFTDFKKTLS